MATLQSLTQSSKFLVNPYWQTKKEIKDIRPNKPFIDQNNRITFATESSGIGVYDENSDGIQIIAPYPNNKKLSSFHTYCYHPSTNKIFIFDPFYKFVMIYNMNNKQWEIKETHLTIGICSECVAVKLFNDKIHFFGGYQGKYHLIYDVMTNKFSKSTEFAQKIASHQIGGTWYVFNDYDFVYLNANYGCFDKCKLPKKMVGFGCIYIQPFILIFGGKCGDRGWSKNIYYLNTNTKKWRKSKIKIPVSGTYHAVLLNDDIHLFKKSGKFHHYNHHYIINSNIILKEELFDNAENVENVENKNDHEMNINQMIENVKIENNENDVFIENVLIVMICIEEYDGDKKNKYKASNLESINMDKNNMIKLFSTKYNYDIITNKHKHCSLNDYKNIVRESQIAFSRGNYQCVMMIFSGHGTSDKLIFSDYEKTKKVNDGIIYKYNMINRSEIECCFDGINVKHKISEYKIFFIDACRGNINPKFIDDESKEKQINGADIKFIQGIQNKNKLSSFHPDANRIIFYPNTENYASYSLKNEGSALLHSLYNTMIDDNNNNKNFLEIQDIMKSQTNHKGYTIKNDDDNKTSKHPVIIESKTVMKYSEMFKMYFQKNKTPKNNKKLSMKNEFNQDYNILFL